MSFAIDVISIFPSAISDYCDNALLKKAQQDGYLTLRCHDLRQWSIDNAHKSVDDTPFGGGAGMVMRPEPFFAAVDDIKREYWVNKNPDVILLSPQGKKLNQKDVQKLSSKDGFILLCGRYEGVDERVVKGLVTHEISLGDFVVMGGEVAALSIIESTARLQKGFISQESLNEESFSNSLLEYPQYTRPRKFQGMKVPEVLLSGNHAKIASWRKKKALQRTIEKRPDLIRNN